MKASIKSKAKSQKVPKKSGTVYDRGNNLLLRILGQNALAKFEPRDSESDPSSDDEQVYPTNVRRRRSRRQREEDAGLKDLCRWFLGLFNNLNAAKGLLTTVIVGFFLCAFAQPTLAQGHKNMCTFLPDGAQTLFFCVQVTDRMNNTIAEQEKVMKLQDEDVKQVQLLLQYTASYAEMLQYGLIKWQILTGNEGDFSSSFQPAVFDTMSRLEDVDLFRDQLIYQCKKAPLKDLRLATGQSYCSFVKQWPFLRKNYSQPYVDKSKVVLQCSAEPMYYPSYKENERLF